MCPCVVVDLCLCGNAQNVTCSTTYYVDGCQLRHTNEGGALNFRVLPATDIPEAAAYVVNAAIVAFHGKENGDHEGRRDSQVYVNSY
jgi:hypothetical protein